MSNDSSATPATWSGVVSALVLASIITGVCLLIAAVCAPKYPEFFHPRKHSFIRKVFTAGKPVVEVQPNPRYGPVVPRKSLATPFVFPWVLMWRSWRAQAAGRRDTWAPLRGPTSLLQHVSLDAHMTQVFLLVCLAFFAICFVLGIPVAIVNATQGGAYPDPLYAIATSRLAQGAGVLWVHYGALALSSFALLALLHWGYRIYERERLRWLSVLAPSSYTVMVTGLPSKAPPSASRSARLRGASMTMDSKGNYVMVGGSADHHHHHTERQRTPGGLAAPGTYAPPDLTSASGSLSPSGVARPPAALTIAATLMKPAQMPKAHRGLLKRGDSLPDVEAGAAQPYAQQSMRPVRFLVAHGRKTQVLERYANAYHAAVEEWEKVQVLAYVAQQRNQDLASQKYGKLGVYKGRRKRVPGKRRQAEEVDAAEDVPAGTGVGGGTVAPAGAQADGRAAGVASPPGMVAAAQPLQGGRRKGLCGCGSASPSAAAFKQKEKARRKEAGAKYTLAEAIPRIESRVRVRYLKLQMVRRHYGAEVVQESVYSAVQPAGAAGAGGAGALSAGILPMPGAGAASTAADGGLGAGVPINVADVGVWTAGMGAARSPPAAGGPAPAGVTVASTPAGHGQTLGHSKASGRTQAGGAASRETAYSEDIEERLSGGPAGAPQAPAAAGKPAGAGVSPGTSVIGGAPPAAAEAAIASVPVDMQQQPRAMEAGGNSVARLRPDPRYVDYNQARAAGVVPAAFSIRMHASDSAFITFADAADAQEVMRRGKACFALGNTVPASAAVLEAYGLPPAGISRTSMNYHNMTVQQAPEPSEMIWANTTISATARWWRWALAIILLAIVVFIAAVPSFCAAALSNLGPLATVIGFLEPVFSWSGIAKGLLQTLIPALIVRVIVALLRTFVAAIAKLRGLVSTQAVELYTARWWFFASYISAVVAYSVASTILGSMNAIINDPSQVLFLLAQSLPQTSGTFVAFTIIAAVQGWSLELLRPVQLLLWVYCRRSQVSNRTLKRQLRGRAGSAPYSTFVPSAALILSIGLLYQFMNPVLIPCLLGYFVISCAIAPHQMLYVYDKPEEAGGRFWVQAVSMATGTLAFTQAVYVAYFIIRKVQVAGYVTIPLLVITLLVRAYWKRRFDRPLAYLPPVVARTVQEMVAAQLLQSQGVGQGLKGAPQPVALKDGAAIGATSASLVPITAADVGAAGEAPGHTRAESKGAPGAATAQGATMQPGQLGEPREPVGAAAGAGVLPGSQLKPRKYAASYRRNVDAVVQRLRGGQADLTQWYLPDTRRPSPYVAWFWKEACDIQPNGFDWTGDGASYPASRMKAWVPPTSGVPGSGDVPAANLQLPLRADEGTVPMPLEGGKLGEPPAQHPHPELGGELSRVGQLPAAAAGGATGGAGQRYMAMADVETQAWVFEEVRRKSLLA